MALESCERSIIEIALGAPFASVVDREFYPSLSQKAAVLMYTLAKSQACEDGNKRLAVILVQAFLALNACSLQTTNAILERVVRDAADSESTRRDDTLAALSTWTATAIVPLPME